MIDIFCLEVLLEEGIVEELPVDLGDLDFASFPLRLPLVLGSVMERRGDLGGFR